MLINKKIKSLILVSVMMITLFAIQPVSGYVTNDHWETFTTQWASTSNHPADGSIAYSAFSGYPYRVTIHYQALFYGETDPWIKIRITEIDVSGGLYYGWAGNPGSIRGMYLSMWIEYFDSSNNFLNEKIVNSQYVASRIVDHDDYQNQNNWYFNNDVLSTDYTTANKLDKNDGFQIKVAVSGYSSGDGIDTQYQLETWDFSRALKDYEYPGDSYYAGYVRVYPDGQMRLWDIFNEQYYGLYHRLHKMEIPPYPTPPSGGGGCTFNFCPE